MFPVRFKTSQCRWPSDAEGQIVPESEVPQEKGPGPPELKPGPGFNEEQFIS